MIYMPTVRLAVGGGKGRQDRCFMPNPEHYGQPPALLVSYFYYKSEFQKIQHAWTYRDWVLDSGAFSAHNSGADIKLQEYIDFCLNATIEYNNLTEIYALDVIGDWRASLANTEAMWAAGVEAIPTYHYGEPEDLLRSLARDYPKVALGGAVGLAAPTKLQWAKQCFARVWPKQLHGFGFGAEQYAMALPFHSVDASSWMFAQASFNKQEHLGGGRILYKRKEDGGEPPHLFRASVEYYLGIERRVSGRWRKTFQGLGWLPQEPEGGAE